MYLASTKGPGRVNQGETISCMYFPGPQQSKRSVCIRNNRALCNPYRQRSSSRWTTGQRP